MKTSNFKFGVMVMAASLVFGAASCKKGCVDPTALNYDSKAKKDNGSCQFEESNEIVKAGFITANETWTSDKVYFLDGKVVVNDGVTLTIQAGTIIKGKQGTGTLASALVIARGAKINAQGTAALPIIFTSELDNIQPGQLSGTNLTETDQGKWGGLIILGRAPISAENGDTEAQIEGLPVTEIYGTYGGTNAADNSGILAYVSIRHGGALIGAGNEINGLTLGGVGTGTQISKIEVISNLDDGIEFFGGTVNVSDVIIGFVGDDGLDVDQNYSGTITNFMVINGANSDKTLEIDGPEGTTYTSGLFNLTNGTTYAFGGGATTADFKSKAQGTVTNVKLGTAKVRASYQNDCTDPKADAFTYLTNASPKLIFASSEVTGTTVYTASKDDLGANDCTVFSADQAAGSAAIVSTTATGATSSTFNAWTWCSVNGKL